MSLFVTLAADILVAVLLAATIVTSLRLSRRIGQMKGDEAALRQTIGDLMVATGTAERAIAGLRAAIDEGDRTLNASLETATIRAGAAHDQDRDGHHDHELLLALRGALGSGLAFLGGGLLRLLGHGIMLSRGRLRARYTWISEHHG
ncbi:DUF6468 domain-containing protein [Methylobacterium organophilum]|nr:DUF6468 domain-containing protein [Methylobacterium organophilum]